MPLLRGTGWESGLPFNHIYGAKGLRVLAALLVLAALGLAAGVRPAAAGAVVDELGRQVQTPDHPQRIVALTPSLVEVLFALGLGDRVKGATQWSDHPPAARAVPRVGSYVAPNLESIVALRPDLVLANREGNPPWVVDKLAEAGVPVYVTWPADPGQLPATLRRLGSLCGAPSKGEALARELEEEMAQVARALAGAAPLPTLLVIGSRPLVSAGPQSYSGKLMTLAGAANVAPDGAGPWPRLSLEYVVQTRPRLVVLSTMERGQDLAREMRLWQEMPGLAGTPGYTVVSMDSDLIDRPGPRLGRGLRQLAHLVHPQRVAPPREKP